MHTRIHGVIGSETDNAIVFTPTGATPVTVAVDHVFAIHRAEGVIVVSERVAKRIQLGLDVEEE